MVTDLINTIRPGPEVQAHRPQLYRIHELGMSFAASYSNPKDEEISRLVSDAATVLSVFPVYRGLLHAILERKGYTARLPNWYGRRYWRV